MTTFYTYPELTPYTRGQIKALLHAAEKKQSRTIKLDSGTPRMMLLTLYATGCSVDELFKLRGSDVDKSKRICFQGRQVAQGRCIPIGTEFRSALMEYLSAKEKAIRGDGLYSRLKAVKRPGMDIFTNGLGHATLSLV